MADLRANVSSYNYEVPTAQQNAMQFGQLQSVVNQNKLQEQSLAAAQMDNARKGLSYITDALSAIGPNATAAQYEKVGLDAVKQGLAPEKTLNVWTDKIKGYIRPDGKFDSQGFYKEAMSSAASHNERLALGTGNNISVNDNSGVNIGKQDPVTGIVTNVGRVNTQIAPGTQIVDPTTLQPGMVGPSGGTGFQSPGLRSAIDSGGATPMPAARPAGLRSAVEPPKTTGGFGPTIDRTPEVPTTFNNRFAGAFPNMIPSGGAPGQAGAMAAVAEQSGKDYATDLTRAKTLQADLQPDLAVLSIIKGKGPTEFGPGTAQLNDIKKLAATWLPGVDPKVIENASDFDTVKKYLVQGARSAGNTGTNDQLAAAFEANPNTTMNTATIENIVKSRVALRKMQNAQTLLFGQQGLPASQYSDWIAKNQNQLDPRAFGFDMMTNEAKSKMLGDMAKQDNNGNWIAKKGKEKEFQKFEKSLSFANDAGLIEPPGRR